VPPQENLRGGKMGVVEEIKQRIDIVEVISDYLPLQKAGRLFRSLCPFHPEKHPSFYVFPEHQSWHCFGACGTGGDVFSFVMKKENVDFGEALRLLAGRANVPIVLKQESDQEAERLRQMNELAAEYYYHLLLHSSAAEIVRSYLAKRGISSKAVEQFQLGFSPDSWEALREYLIHKGYEESELVAAGLVIGKEHGGSYDRFRHRLMFPIRDVKGRVLGFGARALDDSLPKFINSPQTIMFDKGSLLYGIDLAKAGIKRQDLAIVVEGYIDVIIAHQYGFDNVVASMGTSLTEKQVGMLAKLTKNLTLALDADTAGEVAMLRGQGVIAQTFGRPMSVSGWTDVKYENLYNAKWRVAVLPQGKDPDEIIKESTEQWQQLLEQATPVVDYVFDIVASKLDLSKLNDKSSAVDQLLPVINEIKDPVYQAHYLQKLARLVEVEERTLAAALPRRRLSQPKQGEGKETLSTLMPFSSLPLEEYCLSLLLHYPQLHCQAGELSADYFMHPAYRQLFLAWCSAPQPESLGEDIAPALREHLQLLMSKIPPPLGEEEVGQALGDCIHRLREHYLRDLKIKEWLLISEAQSKGDTAEVEELQQLGVRLNTQLKQIFLKQRRGALG